MFHFLSANHRYFYKKHTKQEEKILGSINSELIFTQSILPSSVSKDHLTGAVSTNG